MAQDVHGGLRLCEDHVAEEGFRALVLRLQENRFVELLSLYR